MNIFALGEDILVFHIFPHLSLDELQMLENVPNRQFQSIVKRNSTFLYKLLFLKTYGAKGMKAIETVETDWVNRYRLRSKGKLYIWGQNNLRPASIRTFHIHYPTLVPEVQEEGTVWTDVLGGGFSFWLMSASNEIACVKYTHSNRNSSRKLSDTVQFVEHPSSASSKIISFSSGRNALSYLDSAGNIWQCHPRNLTPIKIAFETKFCGEEFLKSNKVLRILSGWEYCSCYVENVGILVYKPMVPPNFDFRSTSAEKQEEKRLFFYIPNSVGVDDYWIGENFMILIRKGKLTRIDLKDELFTGRTANDEFEEYPLNYMNANLQKGENFTKVDGSFIFFAAYTSKNRILLGNKNDEKVAIPKVLQDNNIVDIQFGDYHCLALAKNGDLYGWGTEPKGCGAIGFRKDEEMESRYRDAFETRDNGDIVLNKIIKLDLGNLVILSLAAGGWSSAAIAVTKEDIASLGNLTRVRSGEV